MRKVKMSMLSITLLIIMLPATLSSCGKDKLAPAPDKEIDAADPDDENPPEEENNGEQENEGQETDDDFILLGSGTGGTLTIDGNTKDYSCKTLLKIKGGTYSRINIRNLRGEEGCPITISNAGRVELTGSENQIRLGNLDHVVVTGDGDPDVQKGFVFKDNRRAIEVDGVLNNFTLQYVSFSGVRDKVITYQYQGVSDGSDRTVSENITFTNIDCENCGQFLSGAGNVDNGVITGLVKNLEISYLTFKNAPNTGTIVWMGNAEDYNIHHNTIDNVGTSVESHNGIFLLMGNGRFYNNKITNHHGNAIRAHGYTVGTDPKEILIYNNIVYNSSKYSAFEVQAFDVNINPGRTTYANAEVFNNTCGRMNTSQASFDGAVVDVYSLKGGKCDVFNNLGFEFSQDNTISLQQSTLIPKESNNLYFSSASAAGLSDVTEFKLRPDSRAKQAGIATDLTVDFYGNPRNSNNPSIGAVE